MTRDYNGLSLERTINQLCLHVGQLTARPSPPLPSPSPALYFCSAPDWWVYWAQHAGSCGYDTEWAPNQAAFPFGDHAGCPNRSRKLWWGPFLTEMMSVSFRTAVPDEFMV